MNHLLTPEDTTHRFIQADCWKALLARAEKHHTVTIVCGNHMPEQEPIYTLVTGSGEMVTPPGSAELLENWLVKKI